MCDLIENRVLLRRKMVNMELDHVINKLNYSSFHEHGTAIGHCSRVIFE